MVCFSASLCYRYSSGKGWLATCRLAALNNFRHILPFGAIKDGHQMTPSSYQTVNCLSSRIHMEKPKDLYAILNVPPSATQQQVKDAYYKLSMKYHPDRNMGSPEAHQKFTSLTEAYSIVGQYQLRKKYDKGLFHQYLKQPHTTQQSTVFTKVDKETRFVDEDKVKFNFDEFYRAHYGAALKRQRVEKQMKKEEDLKATIYSTPESIQQMYMMFTIFSVLGLGLIFFPKYKQFPM